VFAPYTGIKTNLLFFSKGTPTRHIWFYEHPYPPGVKSYNKTKPMKIAEFDAEAAWWGKETDGFKQRVENQYAWKVGIDDIKARNYNLDSKNPHIGEQEIHDPELLLAQYNTMQNDIAALRGQLKGILDAALKSPKSPPAPLLQRGGNEVPQRPALLQKEENKTSQKLTLSPVGKKKSPPLKKGG